MAKLKLPVVNDNVLRPCYIYGEEFNECVTPKGRFHQYFIFGEFLDCSQWQKDYENCLLWKNHKNKIAYDELINSEKKRRDKRLEGHYKNDVWTKRDKPPENWNIPLPDWITEKNKKLNMDFEKKVGDESNLNISKQCLIL